MSVVGYPQPEKAKSAELVAAFCAGAGGRVLFSSHVKQLEPQAAAFYGTVGLERLFAQARARGDWYYMDNAYFDRARQRYFRISHNALQRAARTPALDRLARLAIRAAPWRAGGGHVVIVEQSDYFMRELARWPGGLEAWRWHVVSELAEHTDRPLVVRRWLRDKAKAASSLAEDLRDAWALVTHSSAAANEALLAGVPVFLTGECVAAELGNRDLAQIEAPRRPDDSRDEWAARLAASQWTIEEMRAGIPWRALRQQSEEIAQ